MKHADIMAELAESEKRAWDALSRYEFYLFGYWACHWVDLNRYAGVKLPNPFGALTRCAKMKVLVMQDTDNLIKPPEMGEIYESTGANHDQ